MIQEMKFEVGAKYENMKGVFEIISMGKDSMNIRWEDGEEISSPINLQQRIIERMAHEKELVAEQVAQKTKKAKSPASKGRKEFDGLEENDFSNLVSKTIWRGRAQIGGAVTRLLKSKQFNFSSWVVLRKPEVHWLDVTRQKQEDYLFQVGFHTRVEPDSLCFGFHVPTADPTASGKNDWNVLLRWLDRPENDTWLLKQCTSHGLCLFDMGVKGFTGTLETASDQWVHRSDQGEVPVKSLSAFFKRLDNIDKIELRIEKKVAKGDVIKKKHEVVDDIAGLFNSLMPLYAAAVPLNT